MKTRVQKLGNGLAVRIPKAFARQVGLDENSPVELAVGDGDVRIRPLAARRVSLDRLLRGVTPENRHVEVPTGPAVGTESW